MECTSIPFYVYHLLKSHVLEKDPEDPLALTDGQIKLCLLSLNHGEFYMTTQPGQHFIRPRLTRHDPIPVDWSRLANLNHALFSRAIQTDAELWSALQTYILVNDSKNNISANN